ncbi:DUF6478 family protein [Actibacterium ureilyticum]|uniref:DUF6478 family protein n=1 Tax=Actibacterium ureilyticum TaxID=1590614 RepID=UPI001FE45671|nr:DUF6478 family protein [Actibacterium ureilyticum]
MDRRIKRQIDKQIHRRALRRWRADADDADRIEPARLQELRAEARALRQPLDRLIRLADSRLALPRVGSMAMRKLPAVDWAWRPDLWRYVLAQPGHCGVEAGTQLDTGVKLFHDCTLAEMTARQVRNRREADLAAFGLQIDVLECRGSFVSLVIDLPPEACADMSREHILRVDFTVEVEYPLELFARLNLRSGTRTEQVVRELPVGDPLCHAEFDLAYTGLDEARIDAIWLDLIIESPRMNQITVRDVTFSRRLRAQL